MGPGYAAGAELGPLINAEARGKVGALVDDAVDRGATVLTGGMTPTGAGFYYPPTVLDRVSPSSSILGEEIFGPVAPLVRFEDIDEAVEAANATEFGLVSYLYTEDIGLGLRTAERLNSGMVGLNRGLVSDPSAPFGGMKQSGIGREGGHEGMLEYTETKYIATSW
jgi:succinate-semialdehyde dehydrogenase/glutarate-semialdehyde dehydrogenase